MLLGRSDLAADLGHLGNIGHPAVQAAVESYVRITSAAQKGGMVAIAGEDTSKWADAGMRLLVQGTDMEAIARYYTEAVSAHLEMLRLRSSNNPARIQIEGAG